MNPVRESGVTPDVPGKAVTPLGIAVATAIAGLALVVLIGYDGSPGWRLARVAGALVVSGLVVAAQLRLGDGPRGRAGLAFGLVMVGVGLGFLPFLVKGGAPVVALAGTVALGAGLVLAATGALVATRGRRAVRRLAAGAGTVVIGALVAYVVAPGVASTNVPRPALGASPASVGLTFESVVLTTVDRVELAGWYVPSANRAAVVVLHGAGSTRSDVLDQAAVLAAHGFGALLVDARGHGESGGQAMDFGWHGDADITAAISWLADRPEVDERRIGAVGLSMGGEEAIGATAADERIRAVVAEGATARCAADEAWLSDLFGVRGLVQEQVERLQDRLTDLLTNAAVPTSARAAVEASDARYLLIAAGGVPDEGHAAAHVQAGAPDRVQTWVVPGAGHTQGLRADPAEWEARVTGFLATALGTQAQ
jgi:dienelactone hydrolase